MSDKVNGYIDVWFEARGFGFARIDGDERKFFFHRAYMQSGKAKQGALVKFTIGKTSRGPCALDVEITSATEVGILSAFGGAL